MNGEEDKRIPPAGWVLFDESCEVCSRLTKAGAETLRLRGFEIAPLQAAWVPSRIRMRPSDILDDVRLLLPDGRVVSGADVYRHIMKSIWWLYPFYHISRAPLLAQLFDLGYRWVAEHRHRMVKARQP